MLLARCHFAHRADLIANGWFDVGPTPLNSPSSPVYVVLAQCQPSRWANVDLTRVLAIFNSLEKLDESPYFLLLLINNIHCIPTADRE